MNTIEQQLWDYIDGNVNEIDKKNIEQQIASSIEVNNLYHKLLDLNLAFGELDLDEPSMSFTRNVMESVAQNPAPVALKTKVNAYIIYAIGSFFVLSIFAMFGYVIYHTEFTFPEINWTADLHLNVDKYLTSTTLYSFLFFDLIIGLVFLDLYLRKKIMRK